MKDLIVYVVTEHGRELVVIGLGFGIRLVELSKLKKKYKSVINGLLEDIRSLRRDGDRG